jgi:CRP-like cAMP-binding protein
MAVLRVYRRREVLFHQDSATETFVILSSGVVRLSRTACGCSVVLGVQAAPVSIASFGLLDGGANFVTATADSRCEGYVLPRREAVDECLRHPDTQRWIIEIVCHSMRVMGSTLDCVTLGSVRQRLARALVETVARSGDMQVPLGANLDEFAARIGTVREVLFRQLKVMSEEGLLHRSGRLVSIDNLEALRAVASGGLQCVSPRS